MAAEIADEICIEEIDAGACTVSVLRDLEPKMQFRGLGGPGRVYSFNGVKSGSLADGYWQLTIPWLSYSSPLNDPNLRRLFGDEDSNSTVDADDFAGFGNAFGNSRIAFDFDNNGTINADDFAEFGNRFGMTL